MNAAELPNMIVQALTQHIPAGAAWAPYAAMGVTALFGLILLAKGARLAPTLLALTLLGAGGLGASYVAQPLGTPIWPTIGVGALIGFVLGFLFFRIWLALLLSVSAATISLSVYGATSLTDVISKYTYQNLDTQQQLITLPAAGSVVGFASDQTAAPTAASELQQLWAYLTAQVPNFQTSFYGVVGIAGFVGLLFGLLFPRLSRALWAATAGVLVLGTVTYTALQTLAPQALLWISANGTGAWIAVGVVWLLSLIRNVADLRPARSRILVSDPAAVTAKTASA